ncbi:MAG: hypothetical protein IPG11_18030 [Flavobacteriales bacterium]|nr:hypothetical protein [Flavobacteriales bacterium]
MDEIAQRSKSGTDRQNPDDRNEKRTAGSNLAHGQMLLAMIVLVISATASPLLFAQW